MLTSDDSFLMSQDVFFAGLTKLFSSGLPWFVCQFLIWCENIVYRGVVDNAAAYSKALPKC